MRPVCAQRLIGKSPIQHIQRRFFINFGFWFLVRGFWFLVRGFWFWVWVRGFWFGLVFGFWFLVLVGLGFGLVGFGF
jgi:hypothetical protein